MDSGVGRLQEADKTGDLCCEWRANLLIMRRELIFCVSLYALRTLWMEGVGWVDYALSQVSEVWCYHTLHENFMFSTV